MTEVAVVGSANLDLVVEVDTIPLVGETVLGGDLRRIPGGKGANQAVGAARLGRSVAMIGRLGDDEGGLILRRALDADGIDTTHLLSTAGVPNGVALIAVGGDGDNAIVVSPGANSRVVAADIEGASTVLATATVTLLQLEVPLDAVTAAGINEQAVRSVMPVDRAVRGIIHAIGVNRGVHAFPMTELIGTTLVGFNLLPPFALNAMVANFRLTTWDHDAAKAKTD